MTVLSCCLQGNVEVGGGHEGGGSAAAKDNNAGRQSRFTVRVAAAVKGELRLLHKILAHVVRSPGIQH